MIPHERSLVEKLAGQPFALIGVNTDKNRDEVKSLSQAEKVTWRSFFDGSTGGPICRAWGISSFPTIYVLDGQGVVRFTNLRGPELEKAVETLLQEAKPRNGS